jgi:hypothetical protein
MRQTSKSCAPLLTSAVIATPKLRRGPQGTNSHLPKSVQLWPVASSASLGRFRSAILATDTLTQYDTPGAQRPESPPMSMP